MVKKLLASSICSLVAASMASNTLAAGEHDFEALRKAEDRWEFLDQYCTKCHNFDDYSGGVDFTAFFPEDVPENAELFEKVVKKLRGRMMPPPNMEKPNNKENDQFATWLENYLDEAGLAELEAEHAPLHRLNRKEYANAVRDLLGLDIDVNAMLPEDGQADGFDNIAEALQVSPAFIDQYISAARNIMIQAVGDSTPALSSVVYTPQETGPTRAEGGGSQQFHVEGLPLGTRGGMLVEHWFPADGEYDLSVGDLAQALWVYNLEFRNDLIVTIDGEKIYQTSIGGGEDLKSIDQTQDPAVDRINSKLKNIRFSTTAGPHKVGVSFIRRTFAESDDRLQPFIPGTVQDRILSIRSLEIRGPYNPAGISSTPTRERLFSCYPDSANQEMNCAREIIDSFAAKAYRRDLNEQDKAPLYAFFEQGRELGGFEEGIRRALTRVLVSPNFLYRAEFNPQDAKPGQDYRINSLQMASRLSFFLWSSIPDQELLEVAKADRLHDPDVLEAQVSRMLKDPKAKNLAANFAYQWLSLSKLDEIAPDADIFPYASGAGDLRPDFKEELTLFFDSIFREDRPVPELLTARHSYLNERLALHYGITTVKGNQFRRVELEDPVRWGLLGKGGALMVSSYPNRTSPTVRGNFVLEKIIGSPPPIPPANVPVLKENEAGKVATTVRERLEEHRENPACFSCHSFMDPLGFALENFDAVGRWRKRDRYTGTDIDASGLLPSGEKVFGPIELREALMEQPELFAQSLTEKLMIFATGRPLSAKDMPTVRAIVRAAAKDKYRFSSIVLNIVQSRQFQMSQAEKLSAVSDNNDVAAAH